MVGIKTAAQAAARRATLDAAQPVAHNDEPARVVREVAAALSLRARCLPDQAGHPERRRAAGA